MATTTTTTTIAQGQFTIIDYNDAITLSGALKSNKSTNQRYSTDSNSYYPSWTSDDPLRITPELYKAGSSDDIFSSTTLLQKHIKNVTWKVGNQSAISLNPDYYAFETKTGTNGSINKVLILKHNMIPSSESGITISCEITYTDDISKLDIKHPLSISFTLVKDGSGLVAIEVLTPDGDTFKNDKTAQLTIQNNLIKGTSIDSTQVGYCWAYKTGVPTDISTNFGNITGWKDVTKQDTIASNGFYINGNTLTVAAKVVPSML